MSADARHDLDRAIDHVAARMVDVTDDAGMAMRIVDVLPERSRVGWLVPQLAALSAVAVVAIIWTTRPTPAPIAQQLPSSPVTALVSLSNAVFANEPGTSTALRTQPLERLEPLDPVEPMEVWDGLPSLVVSDVTPRDLPVTPALSLESIGVASLEVADLKLTAESFPQKEE